MRHARIYHEEPEELDRVIRRKITADVYASDGQLERLQRQVEQLVAVQAELLALLCDRSIITLDNVNSITWLCDGSPIKYADTPTEPKS